MESKHHHIPLLALSAMLLATASSLATVYVLRRTRPVPEPDIVVRPEMSFERAPAGTAILYGIIEEVAEKKGGRFVTIDLVEWVQGGDNQEQVALEDGRCTLDMLEQDSCVPNGFYIRKTQKELTLEVSENAIVKLIARSPEGHFLSDTGGSLYQQVIPAASLRSHIAAWNLSSLPFIVTTKQGKVINITEQYLP